MALTTGERDGWPYADLHVKPYAQRHMKVYADTRGDVEGQLGATAAHAIAERGRHRGLLPVPLCQPPVRQIELLIR
jgi:hypothetical protein